MTILPQTVDMKFNCLFDEPQNFVFGFRNRDAPRQVRNVSSEAGLTFFDDDCVSHINHSLSFFNPACIEILRRVREGTGEVLIYGDQLQ